MSGLDWTAIRDQYATLLPRLATRADLSDLIGEMIGELNELAHLRLGRRPPAADSLAIPTGLLGGEVSSAGRRLQGRRVSTGATRPITSDRHCRSRAWVKEGEYILAVNHLPFGRVFPSRQASQNLADKPVVLTVNTKPDMGGARDVVVTPMNLGDEARLRYADWVRGNREYVAQKSGGKIGYIHLPDMVDGGLVAFNNWFYPQLDKEGMVVDVRWNGGGFVSQLIVERLLRKLIWWDPQRNGAVFTYPVRVLNGPFVVLTNQFAGSDGDIFPAAIQTAGARAGDRQAVMGRRRRDPLR